MEWFIEEGADYIIGETFDSLGEAEIALKAIKDHGKVKYLYSNLP